MRVFFLIFMACVFFAPPLSAEAKDVHARRQAVVKAARYILNNYNISYIFGGSQLGTQTECENCNTCLEIKQPKKGAALRECPACKLCGLDCSHFTQLVLTKAGFPMPYLPTQSMLSLPGPTLRSKYKLVDLGQSVAKVKPGDLLVYRGHVVLLEKLLKPGYGDIIHATSGDLRGPGEGVQRRRNVQIGHFRGPLLRVLRHVQLLPKSESPFRKVSQNTPSPEP